MKSNFLISIFLLCSFAVSAFPSKHSKNFAIDQLDNGSYKSLIVFNKLYLECSSSEDAMQLMKEFDQLIELSSNKALNHIAAASTISSFGDHSLALEQLEQLSSQLNPQTAYVKGEYYVILGKISYRAENPKAAIRYIKTGINLLEQTQELEALQIAYTNLGLAYGAIDRHETALVHYDKAAEITKDSSPKIQLYLQLNRALSYTSLGKHDQSKQAFQNALSIIHETNDYFAEVRTYGNLADIYILQDSLAIAEKYLQKGRNLAVEQGFKLDLIRFDLTLAELYKSQGKFERAFLYLQSYDSIRNSVHIEKAAEDVMKLEKLNQVAINKIEQEGLNKTIQLKQQKNWILWIGIILLSLLCFFLLRQFLVIQRKNKVLLKKNLNNHVAVSNQNAKERTDELSDEALALIQGFEELLINKKAFNKSDLTQEKVAKKLGTNRTYLSKAINDHYNMSYSRWLNELRISESKKMLTDEKFNHFSIEGVATSVGFSSLSAFNSNFKSITGLTPSYFRNNSPKH